MAGLLDKHTSSNPGHDQCSGSMDMNSIKRFVRFFVGTWFISWCWGRNRRRTQKVRAHDGATNPWCGKVGLSIRIHLASPPSFPPSAPHRRSSQTPTCGAAYSPAGAHPPATARPGMDSAIALSRTDSGAATPTFEYAGIKTTSPADKPLRIPNSTSSETLHSSGGNTAHLSSPTGSQSDDGMLGSGSSPSSGSSTPPPQAVGTPPTSFPLSASASMQSLASAASGGSASASKRKAVPRRSLSLTESKSDPDIVKLDVFEVFMKQPKRLLEDAEVLPDPAEGLERNPLRRVSSLPQMMSSQGSGYRSDGGFSNDDASSVGSAPAAAGSLSVPPRKRAYTRRVASPVDEDMDDADYHTRLPPMIDTTSYRDRADLASPLLTSALSPGAGSDNPLSPRDGSTSDDEAIAAARELGSLKIFGTGFGYYEDGASAPPKKSRRGSSSSRRAPARRPPSVDASDGSALPPLPQDWGEDDGDGENGPNGAARAVNRSHYPPVSGRGSEGAFQTTQHMPKGQIRSVLVHGRFKDTAGKDVAHWKCTPLRIDSTADRYDELTAEELETCENLRLLPVQYMHIKDIILSQAYNRTFFRKGDARTWFKMDVTKFGRLYDWFDEELGWFPWSPHPSQSAVESMRDFGLNPKLYNRAALVPPSGGAPARGVGGMVGAAQH